MKPYHIAAGDRHGVEADGGGGTIKTKTLDVLRAELLADQEVKRAYDELEPGYEIARAILRARTTSGLTQAELAERMGTSRSFVARLESGRALPSARTFSKIAKATGGAAAVRVGGGLRWSKAGRCRGAGASRLGWLIP
jgi:DNA-binding XRE family transcriptional regulator